MNVQAIAQNIRKNTHPTRGRPNHRSWSCASPCPQGCLGSNIHPDRIPLWPDTPDSPGGWFPSQGEWSACCEKPASPTRIEKWEKHSECRGAPVQPSSWAPLPRTHRPTDGKDQPMQQTLPLPLKIQIVLDSFQIPGLDSSVNCLPCRREKS